MIDVKRRFSGLRASESGLLAQVMTEAQGP